MDEHVFRLIEKITNEHSNKVFGFLDQEDLKQEIWIICLEKLKEYDKDRGELEHFLRIAVKTRLINKFKDITKSVRSPCTRCPFFRPDRKIDCGKFKTKKEKCYKWNNYLLSINSRNSLLNATGTIVERKINDRGINKMITDEVKTIILENLKKEFWNDFETMIAGGKLSIKKVKKLQEEINKIVYENDKMREILKHEEAAD